MPCRGQIVQVPGHRAEREQAAAGACQFPGGRGERSMGSVHYFAVADRNRCPCGQAPQSLKQQVTGRVRGLSHGQRGVGAAALGQQHQLRMPVTVLQQDWGTALGFDAAALWDAWAPDLRHSTVSYGHFMAEEAPADIAKEIRDLLSRCPCV